ncbi:MAG: hypothetical protein HOD85_15615 [Deltaproteobacteria bacterium]|nr:hypothetical protein [Deltaproteobacteria bacterium]
MNSNVIEMNRGREPKEVVEDTLKTLCATYTHKMSPALLMGWNIGLEDVPDKYILEGLKWTLKNWEGSFMPKVGEFVKICRDLRKKRQIRKQIEQKIDNQYDGGEPMSRDEAKEMYSMLQKLANAQRMREALGDIGKKKEEPRTERLQVYEYYDRYAGNFYYLCKGHAQSEFFRSECRRLYGVSVMSIKHKHKRAEDVKVRDEKGDVESIYSAYSNCQNNDMRAEPITLGYCR